jgi:predicted ATPase
MLRNIRFQHFKRFLDTTIPLRPMTVLTGLNGGGKTSVLHGLLLLRQASAGTPPPQFVQLNGPFGLELGELQDVLHRAAEPEDGILLSVDDDSGTTHAWRFDGSDERSLNLEVTGRPPTPPRALAGTARSFTYLSAERLGPRDVLGASSVSNEDLYVGYQGQFTAHVLAALGGKLRVSDGRLNPRTEESGGVPLLRQQVELWLSDIARPVALDAEWLPGSGVTIIRYRTPGNPVDRTRPTNMGFGVTYALPVVVAALMAPSDSILMIENPEAHLHPSGQSAIGAFLARAAADGVQVIVETHSDHVINGIRRAVGELAYLPAESVVVDFLRSNEQDEPELIQLDVQPHGELSDWPVGFLDQLDNDLAALARARRRDR